MEKTWQESVAAVWAEAESIPEAEVVRRIDALVSEADDADPDALFESASARDFAGREADAIGLYQSALDRGLAEPQRSRAVIQLASSMRNVGRPQEAIDVLQGGFADDPDHPLADAARAFLSLCLLDTGDARAATAVALDALAAHLPQYSRSVRAYAAELTR